MFNEVCTKCKDFVYFLPARYFVLQCLLVPIVNKPQLKYFNRNFIIHNDVGYTRYHILCHNVMPVISFVIRCGNEIKWNQDASDHLGNNVDNFLKTNPQEFVEL